MDFTTFPVGAGGYKSVLVLVDYFTRFIWAKCFKGSGMAKQVIGMLQDVYDVFGNPTILASDGGSHFRGEVTDFCARRGIRQHITPAYQPHTNGLVEGANNLIASTIAKLLPEGTEEDKPSAWGWPALLPSAVALLNTRVVRSMGHTPAELMFNRERRQTDVPDDPLLTEEEVLEHTLPGWDPREAILRSLALAEGQWEAAFATLEASQVVLAARDADRKRGRDWEFAVGDEVMVHKTWQDSSITASRKLLPCWYEPMQVVERLSPLKYTVADALTGENVAGEFHANRLRPYGPKA